MKTKLPVFLFSAALILTLSGYGCQFGGMKKGEKEDTESQEQSETKKTKPSLFKAMEKFKETAEKMEEMSKRGPVEPVNFRDLLTVFPSPPSGWTAEEDTDARTVKYGEWKYTYAKQGYRSEDGKRQVTLKITDGAYIQPLYAVYNLAPAFSEESLESYKRGFEKDGLKGWEEFTFKDHEGSLNVMAYDRFIIEIEASGFEKGEAMHAWLDRIDLQKLAAWSQETAKGAKAR